MRKLLLVFPTATINYIYSSLLSLAKDFSPFKELQGLERPPHYIENIN